MANWFVRSLATGTGAGTSWTNATTTIAAAITLSAAGDTFFVADDHAETSASSITLAFKGSLVVQDTILCADHTITSPTSSDLKTTATVTTTGTAAALTITGNFYCYGITFNCGTSTSAQLLKVNSSTAATEVFQNCGFAILGTGATNIQASVGSSSRTRWINCTVSFGAVGSNLRAEGDFVWTDTPSAIVGATIPTFLFTGGATIASLRVEGVDLSALGSGKSLVSLSVATGIMLFKECKLGASVGVTTNSGGIDYRIDLVRCDSANTNYRNESYSWTGTQTTETTIVRTGGATDGTTSFSQKIVTTANSKFPNIYDLLPIAIWNDTTGSAKTVTVEGIASAVPNNDEVWMDVEYMGNASFSTGSRATTYKTNVLATAAANTTSTSTWGGALTGKFQMAVTITPQQKGPITVYVKVAKASTTVYIDPFITVT